MSSRLFPPAGGPEPDCARGSLVLLRHGRTRWNDEGRITGWEDPPLSEEGADEATRAGQLISAVGLSISTVYTSLTQRARDTAELVLASLDGHPPMLLVDWRLNERHFGLLQGLDRATATHLYGRKALRAWKHDPAAVPPHVLADDGRHPIHDARYRHVVRKLLPGAESIVQHADRVLECWQESINPHLDRGVNVLVVSHCHSLRVLATQLDTPPTPSASPRFLLPGATFLYPGRGNARELTLTNGTPPDFTGPSLAPNGY